MRKTPQDVAVGRDVAAVVAAFCVTSHSNDNIGTYNNNNNNLNSHNKHNNNNNFCGYYQDYNGRSNDNFLCPTPRTPTLGDNYVRFWIDKGKHFKFIYSKYSITLFSYIIFELNKYQTECCI